MKSPEILNPRRFLTEIPDFGGDSLINHPEPEGNFGNFPRAEGPREISKISRRRGVISANPRQNQEFLLNSGFCTSFAISKYRSTLPWFPGVSIFSKYVGIQLSQSSTCIIVQNTIFNTNNLTIILQVSKITNSTRFLQNTIYNINNLPNMSQVSKLFNI